MPKFSVLMSVYKNEKPQYLKQSIESIVTQTLMPNEIVIVKDGSLTNDLNNVICFYQKKYTDLFKIVAFQENRGLGLALRDGVMACTYEYIARMDTDDISIPERFEKQFKYLEENPETVLLGSWIKEFSITPQEPDSITQLPCTHQDILNFSKKRNPFRHMTMIFKKQVVLDCGNYRDFLWFEDYDLWIRILQRGYKTANLAEYLVNVRADNEMFARRGGWMYLKQELKFQKFLWDNNFINLMDLIKNIFIRSIVRILPNKIRTIFYRKILRSR